MTASPRFRAVLRWAGLAGRLIVGGVLVVAGALKAARPAEEFAYVIDAYRVVSSVYSLNLARMLPWIEMFLGFSLVIGNWTKAGAVSAGILLAGFLSALLSLPLRGLSLPDCGCFGGGFHPSIAHAVLMDAVLLFLCVPAFLGGERAPSWDAWVESGRTPGNG